MARREKCIRKLGRQIIKTTIQNLKTAKEKYMSHLRTSIIDTELLENDIREYWTDYERERKNIQGEIIRQCYKSQ